jgi:hypothetical protein
MKRCDKCGKLSHYIYHMQLGQFPYNFCSGICANNARLEYEEKKKSGVSPSNPEPVSDLIEEEGEF